MEADKSGALIQFDDLNRIRLLDPELFSQTGSLAEECTAFQTKIEQFNNVTKSLVELLSAQSKKIEQEKLLAIGERNRVASETEMRLMKQQELQALIQQKKLELDRERAHHASLVKVEQEQQALIERLTKRD